jgi:aminoglycoside phosphotransferase (APT) family kinase protein
MSGRTERGGAEITPTMPPEPSTAWLSEWAAETLGVPAVRLASISSGNSRRMWTVAPDSPAAPPRWVLRAQVRSAYTDAYPLSREAAVYAGLNRTPLPVPLLHAVAPDGNAFLVDLAPGRSNISELAPGARHDVVGQFLRRLADLHATPLSTLGLDQPPLAQPASETVADHRTDELERWEAIMRSATAPDDPLLEFGLRWLRTNGPVGPIDPVLVHGDAGPGNFLFDDSGITAIIDWELAHAGDPVEDLAWVTLRSALDQVPGVDELLDGYEQSSAVRVERGNLNYYQAFILWKVMVIRHLAIGNLERNLGRNIYYRLLHRRMFVEVMAANLKVSPADASPVEHRTTPRSWLYDACAHHLKHTALPAVSDDPSATASLAGLVRVVRYLKAWDTADVEPSSTDDTELCAAIRTGALDDRDAYRQLSIRESIEQQVCAGLVPGADHVQLAGLRGRAQGHRGAGSSK